MDFGAGVGEIAKGLSRGMEEFEGLRRLNETRNKVLVHNKKVEGRESPMKYFNDKLRNPRTFIITVAVRFYSMLT